MILLNLLKQEDELTKRKEKIKLSLDAYDSTNRTKNTKRNSQNPNILIKRFDLIHKNLIVLSSLCYNEKQLSEGSYANAWRSNGYWKGQGWYRSRYQ